MKTVTSTIYSTWDDDLILLTEAVHFSITYDEEALLIHVDAPFHDDPPPPVPQGSTDELWNYEVVEFFFAEEGKDPSEARYTEIECSPHGHYLVLQFEGERQLVRSHLPLEFFAMIQGGNWQGMLKVPYAILPPPPYRFNVFAIHGVGENRRYLALYPTLGEAPNFHRLAYFRPLE